MSVCNADVRRQILCRFVLLLCGIVLLALLVVLSMAALARQGTESGQGAGTAAAQSGGTVTTEGKEKGGWQDIGNRTEIVSAIRSGLREHSRRITVRFPGPAGLEPKLMASAWVEEALEETENPCEGDYIRYQTGGYTLRCVREKMENSAEPEDSVCWYRVRIEPQYYMYLEQEEVVTQRLAEVFDAFGFTAATSDAEKLLRVYAYVCDTVRYDLVHQGNPYATLRSTAYAALIGKTATCQGYCVLLYRMLRESGIDCRIVTGTANGTFHAWNLAALDGSYYYLDAAWDAGTAHYTYFLRGASFAKTHIPDARFQTEAFRLRYPVADADASLGSMGRREVWQNGNPAWNAKK